MCYPEPGPRCSNHARALRRETKAALVEADGLYWDAKDSLAEAEVVLVEAEKTGSDSFLELARAKHTDAIENRNNSEVVRDEKLKAHHKAFRAFLETPEGIQRLWLSGDNDEAEKLAAIHMSKIAEFERVRGEKGFPDMVGDETLRVLANDPDDDVAMDAINNWNASLETIAVAARSGRIKLVGEAIQSDKWDAYCRKNPTPTVDNSDLGRGYERAALMDRDRHPSREHFERLAKDRDWTVVIAVAIHPDCPDDIKQDLRKHPILLVRQATLQETCG